MLCVQNDVILITKFKSNIMELKHHDTWQSFPDAINDDIADCLRRVIMKAMMVAIGLVFPIVFFWSYRKRVESGIVSRI